LRFVRGSAPSSTVISTFSLHDALPIYQSEDVVAQGDQGVRAVEEPLVVLETDVGVAGPVVEAAANGPVGRVDEERVEEEEAGGEDRKSTRLNSSHVKISYAVFCLEKKT